MLLRNSRDRPHDAPNLQKYIVRHPTEVRRLAHTPIETPHMLAKNDSMHRQPWRQNHLELVTLYLA